jgi:hypothetical protein|tara:strand:+ start:2032 stop:2844 length:813 start_codon:yes stop_codon:yes gene_type:complete
MDHCQKRVWPDGWKFLEEIEALSEEVSRDTDKQRELSGTKYPLTLENLGTLLSFLYRAASCEWGCRGGDHQTEWLVGRVVNQGIASYRLLRSGFYDESLMLTRGIGEIANLLWLFREEDELEHWRTAERSDRLKHFSPAAVRKKLRSRMPIEPPISDSRYRQLCEVGSHPVPWIGPNLFSGSTRPILGHVVQPLGLMIAVNELCFAASVAAPPVALLLNLKEEAADGLQKSWTAVFESIGGITIDRYHEFTSDKVKTAAAEAKQRSLMNS